MSDAAALLLPECGLGFSPGRAKVITATRWERPCVPHFACWFVEDVATGEAGDRQVMRSTELEPQRGQVMGSLTIDAPVADSARVARSLDVRWSGRRGDPVRRLSLGESDDGRPHLR